MRLHDFFDKQADAQPEAPAVILDGEVTTYRDIQEQSRRIAQGPTPGTLAARMRAGPYMGRKSGRAGEINVRERTRSGRVPASRVAMAPPRELPNRWTGPRPRGSMSRATTIVWASTE